MATTTYSAFDPGPADLRRSNRAITWSIVVHAGLLAVVLVTPRSWWTNEPERRTVMTISLGGSPGPRTTGQTSVGGRTVEEVAPPPRRPDPVRPVTPTPPAPTTAPPVRALPPPPRPSTAKPAPARPTTTARATPRAPATSSRPPVTGSAIARGNTAADTGATGQGAGLASGGRISGGEADLANFCCPQYLESMLASIDSGWNKNQPERGTTTLKFTVNRDGSITGIEVEQGSGYSILDRAARSALMEARLPPLPPDYTRPTLTVHLKFPYGAL